MLDRAEQGAVVSIAWLMAQLGRRSFGLTLLVALIAALASLSLTAATLWGTVETIDWLDPA